MLKPRIIKPDFWLDESIGACTITARLFFIGLWAAADSKGFFQWVPLTLRLLIIPNDQVDGLLLLEELEDAELIIRRERDGEEVGKIIHFDDYQDIDLAVRSC